MAAPSPFGNEVYLQVHLISDPEVSGLGPSGALEWDDDAGQWAIDEWTAVPNVTDYEPHTLVITKIADGVTYIWRLAFDFKPNATHWVWKENQNSQEGADHIVRPSLIQLDRMASSLPSTGVIFQHVPTSLGNSIIVTTAAGAETIPFSAGSNDYEPDNQVPPAYWLIQPDDPITLTQLFFNHISLEDNSYDYEEFTLADELWTKTLSQHYDNDGNVTGEATAPLLAWACDGQSWPDPDLTTPGFGRGKGFSRANGHRKNTGFKKSQGF